MKKKILMIVTILIAVSWIIPFTSDNVQFVRNNEPSPTEATPEWTPSKETWIISLGCTLGLMIIGFGLNIKKIRLNRNYLKTKSTTSSYDKDVEDISDNLSDVNSSSYNPSNVSGSTDDLLRAMLNVQIQDPPETTGDSNPIEMGDLNPIERGKKKPNDLKEFSDPKDSKKANKNRKS